MAIQGGGNRSTVKAIIGTKEIFCQVDSAADYNIMREDAFSRIKGNKGVSELARDHTLLKGAGGTYFRPEGVVTAKTVLEDVEYNLDYKIVSQGAIPVEVLLGDPLLDHANVSLGEHGVVFEPIVGDQYVLLLQEEMAEEVDLTSVPMRYKEKVRRLIKEYKPVGVEKTPVRLRVVLKDMVPVFTRPFRLSPLEQEEVDIQVDDWLKRGIIRPSHSEYASPALIARKRDGSPRLCINFKKLNAKVEKQHFPAPIWRRQRFFALST